MIHSVHALKSRSFIVLLSDGVAVGMGGRKHSIAFTSALECNAASFKVGSESDGPEL